MQKILSIQLPYVDNHIGGYSENLKLAGVYLRHALEAAPEGSFFGMSICPSWTDGLNDGHFIDHIVKKERPSVIAATLYVWNIERTLDILRAIKKRLSSVHILAGGPEVAPDHPFLFRDCIPDAVAVGEGEQVFPAMLKSLRTGKRTNFRSVAWRCGRKYVWGKELLLRNDLGSVLPHPSYRFNVPDSNGIAYMETSRGCPLKCAFCCYNQKRQGVSFIRANEVVERAKILIRRGAKEIRFVDPTFNSNPDFVNILHGLIGVNSNRKVSFFAEIRAERITREQAVLLSKANFMEVEAGMQSRDSSVLRAIRRPTDIRALDRGIKLMAGRGIELTVDVMCGLPYQTLSDIKKSLLWVSMVKNARLQFLHTLLIPGTELRERRRGYGIDSQSRPPYRVTSTRLLSIDDMSFAEQLAMKYTDRLIDSPAVKFVGRDLPDLFDERVRITLSGKMSGPIAGKSNRRVLVMKGAELYRRRSLICEIIRNAIETEPYTLWQFVVQPVSEEPLDLFDQMVEVIDSVPQHFLDLLTVVPGGYRRVARRVFVQLGVDGRYGKEWIAAVNDILRSKFY